MRFPIQSAGFSRRALRIPQQSLQIMSAAPVTPFPSSTPLSFTFPVSGFTLKCALDHLDRLDACESGDQEQQSKCEGWSSILLNICADGCILSRGPS